jgi:hypothetical protein
MLALDGSGVKGEIDSNPIFFFEKVVAGRSGDVEKNESSLALHRVLRDCRGVSSVASGVH